MIGLGNAVMPNEGKQLHELGYLFIARLDENYIILRPMGGRDYLLFRQIDNFDPSLPSIRKKSFVYVKPITETLDPTLFFIAHNADEERITRKTKRRTND